jgi:hypothetical protein
VGDAIVVAQHKARRVQASREVLSPLRSPVGPTAINDNRASFSNLGACVDIFRDDNQIDQCYHYSPSGLCGGNVGPMENQSRVLDRSAARARHGDDPSRNELLRVVWTAVRRCLLAHGLPDHDADDLLQQICSGVLRGLPDDGTVANRVGHSYSPSRKTRFRITDLARTRAVRRDVLAGHDTDIAVVVTNRPPGPTVLVGEDEGSGRIQALIKGLSKGCRRRARRRPTPRDRWSRNRGGSKPDGSQRWHSIRSIHSLPRTPSPACIRAI